MNTYEQMLKARYLRRKETKAEKILWEELRNNKLNTRFRRQHPIDMFVVDFYCPEYRLAVELDGKEHSTKGGREYDQTRTEYLNLKGINILRFWNNDVEKDIPIVIKTIQAKMSELS